MEPNDPIDLLKESARRAAKRHSKIRRYIYTVLGILALVTTIYFIQNLPEQKFVRAHVSDDAGSIKIRGDYTNFWEVTENEPPQRDLFQSWPQEIIAKAASNRCGSEFAILVHEPHNDIAQEHQLFYLLWYLQRDHPNLFSNLIVFQEGSAAHPLSNRTLLHQGALFSNEKKSLSFALLPHVLVHLDHSGWAFTSSKYSPTNSIDQNSSYDQIASKIFNLPFGYVHENWDVNLQRNIEFHSFPNENGSIDTQNAFKYLLENSDISDKKASIAALEQVEPEHANLAEYLLSGGYLRAAFAYEIFAEGFSGQVNQTVDVFGIEDISLYGASCKLQTGCSGDTSEESKDLWATIQPYRRAVMANNILRTLQKLDSGTVPVILASIHSHLVDIRGYLCDAGYDTIGLTPTRNVESDLLTVDVLRRDQPNLFDIMAPQASSNFGTTPLGFPTIEGSILDVLRRAGRMKARPPRN